MPKTNFARRTSLEKEFIFRVPAEWKQEGTELKFEGPHTAELIVFVQKVPDGYPLQDYFGAMLQAVKDAPGVAETPAQAVVPLAPSPPRIEALNAERFALRMSVGQDFLDELNQVKSALSHVIPGGDLETVLRACMKLTLEACAKRKRGAPRTVSAPATAPALAYNMMRPKLTSVTRTADLTQRLAWKLYAASTPKNRGGARSAIGEPMPDAKPPSE